MRAAIYCRVSTQDQGERGYSLDAQAQDCRALADEIGAEVAGVWQDVDSGAAWDLPGLMALLDAARRREFSVLVCYDPDRLARRLAKQMVLVDDLQRSGVVVKYCTLRVGDTAEDRLLTNVRAVIAEYEREKIALRTTRGRYAKAQRGLVVGSGPPPYGYRYARDLDDAGRSTVVGLAVRDDTATVVRRIFTELLTEGVTTVADRLNAEGIPSPRGGRWGPAAINVLTRNHAYYGLAEFGKRTRAERARRTRDPSPTTLTMAVPALVTRTEWLAVQDALAFRQRHHGQVVGTVDDRYELRGLLVCAACDRPMAVSRSNGLRYYRCPRHAQSVAARQGTAVCPMPMILADDTEALVWQSVLASLLDPRRVADDGDAAQPDAAADDARARLEQIDRDSWRLRQRVRRITEQLLDTVRGSESERTLRDLAQDADAALARLQREREQLERLAATDDTQAMQALEELAAYLLKGSDLADADARRQIYAALELRVLVAPSPQGERIGRRTFRVDLLARISVSVRSRDQYSQKYLIRLRTARAS